MTENNNQEPNLINPDSLPPGTPLSNQIQANQLATSPPNQVVFKNKFDTKMIIIITLSALIIVAIAILLFLFLNKKTLPTKKYGFSNEHYQFDIPKGWTFTEKADGQVEGLDASNSLRKITIKNYGDSSELSEERKQKAIENAKKFLARPDTVKEQFITISRAVGEVNCIVKRPTCTKGLGVFDNNLTVVRSAAISIIWEQADKTKLNQEIDNKFSKITDPNSKMTQMNKLLQEQNMMDISERDFEDEFFSNFRFTPLNESGN